MRALLCPDKLNTQQWLEVVETGTASCVAPKAEQQQQCGPALLSRPQPSTCCALPQAAALCLLPCVEPNVSVAASSLQRCCAVLLHPAVHVLYHSACCGPAHHLHTHVWTHRQHSSLGAPPAVTEGAAGVQWWHHRVCAAAVCAHGGTYIPGWCSEARGGIVGDQRTGCWATTGGTHVPDWCNEVEGGGCWGAKMGVAEQQKECLLLSAK